MTGLRQTWKLSKMNHEPQVMTASCTTYLMVPPIILSDKIVPKPANPGIIEGKRCNGDIVVEKTYAQWHQHGDH